MPKQKLKLYNSNNLTKFQYVIILVISFITIHVIYVYSTRFERTITIKDKHTFSTEGNVYSKYSTAIKNTVSDENGIIYEISSSFPLLHFRAAEILLNIEKNKKYKISGYGWRIPILGIFPNIVAAVPQQ